MLVERLQPKKLKSILKFNNKFNLQKMVNSMKQSEKISSEIISDIIGSIVEFYKKGGDSNFLSISLMGSMSNKNARLTKLNDLDLFYLFKKMDFKSYEKLKQLNEQLVKQFSTNKIQVHAAYRGGHIKCESNKEINILIHNLMFDVPVYKILPSVLKVSCQHHSVRLFGTSFPGDVVDQETTSLNDIIAEPRGIRAYKDMIEREVVQTEYWDFNEKTNIAEFRIGFEKVDKHGLFEIISAAAITVPLNVVRMKDIHCPFDQGVKRFVQLPELKKFSLLHFPERIVKLKDDVRNGKKKLSDLDIKKLKEECIIFLSKFEEYLYLIR